MIKSRPLIRTFCKRFYTSLQHEKQLLVMQQKQAYLMDIEGTLWKQISNKDYVPCDGVEDFLKWSIKNHKHIMFCSNTSDHSNTALYERFTKIFGSEIYKNFKEDQFYNVMQCCSEFIHCQKPYANVYLIGGELFKQSLEKEGLSIKNDDTHDSIDYVVIGNTKFDYHALNTALNILKKGKTHLIGTITDLTKNVSGKHVITVGSITEMLSKASNIKPYYIGKPNSIMLDYALKHLNRIFNINVHKNHVAMIGDRMDVDVKAGLEYGIDTILVLTGKTVFKDSKLYPFKPSIILHSLKDLTH